MQISHERPVSALSIPASELLPGLKERKVQLENLVAA